MFLPFFSRSFLTIQKKNSILAGAEQLVGHYLWINQRSTNNDQQIRTSRLTDPCGHNLIVIDYFSLAVRSEIFYHK